MKDVLEGFGLNRDTMDHALELDAILQAWRRRVQKRELGQMALRELGVPVDLPKLDVMIAIWAPSNEFSEDREGETMVATIAARLGIDPSRASRLVTELIAEGYAERAVSQQDARRTIVTLTGKGRAVVTAVRTIKFLILGSFLSDWSEEELATLTPLLHRLSHWQDEIGSHASDRYAREVATLREELARQLAEG
ncbi:MarR family winged helix-turn-helix transcriptional regulator [Pseudooceanicola nitratireducens]|jgi:DNA-binding MarR family transcriptional regulator|uniref:DNA-binding transcriptional regulator, MarR family n=1 Tax=Pseudooceanicola nitratireducens TaxID=517719 RepID=A0A1I1NBF7_9RHOB|nr:MarR family winged helix-turn-helix transcriptional regulator [Pseudooceanicola nitratireducens]MEC7297681.1 MarR family winged helix-turn-helix transcriptional regulator [Pseudomonadota bacterium]MBY6156394.1 MarR family winged helix-turn-helix transcriptional regulator [Pseudooceanicola nitratireducens]MBY6166812.1 MarR family winged helix-turn-helix transcriptional regulator [Pseudooceanicola nitratireducens]MEC7794864.1 MarR family winged helix-turn-helix transcriptional regulator [Pseud